jgi:hypothetical protein
MSGVTLRRLARAAALGGAGVVAAAVLLVITNPAPRVPEIPEAEVRTATAPYVVKLHAQWCPLCMLTKGVWSSIERSYTGRVRLVVFDFTSDATTRATEVEARRLGLGPVFDEYAGETGTILLIHGTTRQVIGNLHGERDFEVYRAAIDTALAESQP